METAEGKEGSEGGTIEFYYRVMTTLARQPPLEAVSLLVHPQTSQVPSFFIVCIFCCCDVSYTEGLKKGCGVRTEQ